MGRLCVLGVLGVLCGGSLARAQWAPEVVFGVEVRRDRFQYHFENPSSFDTPFSVPHVFEQRYVADNVWAVLAVRYSAGLRWETSIGATPQRTATADDYDIVFRWKPKCH